jgi:hypothetical protein
VRTFGVALTLEIFGGDVSSLPVATRSTKGTAGSLLLTRIIADSAVPGTVGV